MTTIAAPMCAGCKHFRMDSPRIACDAYPGGIPNAIVESRVDHREPYAGDRGIQFEASTADDARYADSLFATAWSVQFVSETTLDPAVWGYSPNQPRKSDGKFGTGGGGRSAPASGGGGGTPGVTEDGMASRLKIQEAMTDEAVKRIQGGSPLVGTEAYGQTIDRTSRQLKRQAMVEAGLALDAQFPAERLQAVADKFDSRHMRADSDDADLAVATPGMLVADRVLNTWAGNAWNPNNDNSVALQVAMAEEFKTGTSPHMKGAFDGSGDTILDPVTGGFTRVHKGDIDAWPAANGYDMEVVRSTVRVMYDNTQKHLTEMGVGDTVTLYRGVGKTVVNDNVDIDLNPGSSWTTHADTANLFGRSQAASDYTSGTGSRLVMTVPRSRIIALPGSGVGCYEESEVVISRGSGDKASWRPTT